MSTFPIEKKIDIFYKTAMTLVVVVLFCGPMLHTLKLLRYGNHVGSLFFYITFPLTTFLFFLSLMFGRKLVVTFPDVVATCVLLLLGWGALLTFIHGGQTDDILGNFLRIVLVYSCYQTSRYYARADRLWILPKVLSFWGGIGVCFAVLIIYACGVFSSAPVYLGLGTAPAIFTLAYVLSSENKNKKIYALLVLLLFFLGGKRGYMIAAFAMLFAHFFLEWRFSFRKIAKGLVIGLIAVGVFLFFVSFGLNNYLPPQLSKRFNVASLDDSNVIDVRKLTSGRNLEIDAVLEMWREDPKSAFLGLGLGATFVNEAGNKDSTVHVSPVAMAFIFGLPLATIVLIIVWSRPLLALFRLRRSKTPAIFWCLASIGFLFSTLSVFTFLQSPGLWVSLGCLSGQIQSDKKNVREGLYGNSII